MSLCETCSKFQFPRNSGVHVVMCENRDSPRPKRRSHRSRPSCIEYFQCSKLRHAEGLKRHLVDSCEKVELENVSNGNRTSSRRRCVSPRCTGKRRSSTSVPASDVERTDVQSASTRHEPSTASREPILVLGKSQQSKRCSRCSKTFTTAAQLHKHAASHYVPFKCPLCSQTLPSLSLLKAHINSVHV